MALTAKKVFTPLKVGVFVVGAFVALAAFLQIVSTRGLDAGDSYIVYAYFDDVLGLEKKSPVQIAGIDIGAIDEVTLDQGKAKLKLRIYNNIALYQNAKIEKIAISLLGDYKLSVEPGEPPAPQLKDGDWITNVRSVTDTEEIIAEVRKMSTAMSKLIAGTPEQPAPLELIVKDVQQSAAAARQVIEVVSQNIGQNTQRLDQILENVERFTQDLSNISAGKERDIDAITADAREIARSLRVTSQALEQIIAGKDEKEELRESVKSLKSTLDKLNTALERFANIAEKIDEGEGTVGKLVNDPSIHENVEEATQGIADLVGGLTRLQTWVNLRSEFQFRAGAAKNYLQITLMPKEDKYYILEVVDDPRGVRTTVVEDVETTSPEPGRDFVYRERRSRTVDGLKFSLQFAKRYYWLALRFGIIENTGGVGANIFLLQDRFEFAVDANQFGDEVRNPRLKTIASLELIPHVYLTGGVDDILNPGTIDFFVGGGVKFNDEDLKYLLFTAGSVSGSASSGR
jgi:phospholipid/cholesterol/gamma-HCH transport system substrate-binding protein